MSWTKCPVCDGRGVVDKVFYPDGPAFATAAPAFYQERAVVACRACNYRGVLETKEEIVNNITNHYSIFGSRALAADRKTA